MSDLLVDRADVNHYVFELYAEGVERPIRREVVKTRKGPDQARATLPAVADGYFWALDSLSGPYAESLQRL